MLFVTTTEQKTRTERNRLRGALCAMLPGQGRGQGVFVHLWGGGGAGTGALMLSSEERCSAAREGYRQRQGAPPKKTGGDAEATGEGAERGRAQRGKACWLAPLSPRTLMRCGRRRECFEVGRRCLFQCFGFLSEFSIICAVRA